MSELDGRASRIQRAIEADDGACSIVPPDADARAVDALRELFALIEDGLLVRNTTNDGHMPSFLAESTRLVKALAVARAILDSHAPAPTTPPGERS